MASRDDLVHLVSPPVRSSVVSPDWSQVEARLAMRLPADYKWIVENYGPGAFDDFLHVFQPGVSNENVRLEHQIVRSSRTLDSLLESGEIFPYEASLLIPVCRTENGDTCYWLQDPLVDPDAWVIVVNEARGPSWVRFSGGVVDFIFSIISGATTIEIFPDDFPGDEPEFVPYQA